MPETHGTAAEHYANLATEATHSHAAAGTSDPQLKVSVALRRMWANDQTCAATWIRELDPEQLRQAATVLRRLGVLVETVLFEPAAEEIAARGVEGYAIGTRS